MDAAQDHAALLRVAYSHGNHALTVYISGLSAECLFRAFRAKKGMPFRSDHSLDGLSEDAGFPDALPQADRQRFVVTLAEVINRWRNSHRFRSNEALRRFLKGLKLDRGIRGDYVKENARIASSGALEVIAIGIRQWQRKYKK